MNNPRNLTGSEKQITWASEIIQNALNALEPMIDNQASLIGQAAYDLDKKLAEAGQINAGEWIDLVKNNIGAVAASEKENQTIKINNLKDSREIIDLSKSGRLLPISIIHKSMMDRLKAIYLSAE